MIDASYTAVGSKSLADTPADCKQNDEANTNGPSISCENVAFALLHCLLFRCHRAYRWLAASAVPTQSLINSGFVSTAISPGYLRDVLWRFVAASIGYSEQGFVTIATTIKEKFKKWRAVGTATTANIIQSKVTASHSQLPAKLNVINVKHWAVFNKLHDIFPPESTVEESS